MQEIEPVTAGKPAVLPTAPVSPDSNDSAGLIQAELAFAAQAQHGVNAAFLTYLAEDSLVLSPKPVPGRALYVAATGGGQLQWFPTLAVLAASGDLGFTCGPWTATSASGTAAYGHFVSIWKHDVQSGWRVVFDGGVQHTRRLPPPHLAAAAASARAASPLRAALERNPPAGAQQDFGAASHSAGILPALRTYARNSDFVLIVDGEEPMSLAPADAYLRAHSLQGDFVSLRDAASTDSSIAYSIGEFSASAKRFAYAQIWQFDPLVANWGVRLLLLVLLPSA